MRHLLGSMDLRQLRYDIVPTTTYPKINVYLSEDIVFLLPSGNCQSVLKQRLDPLQT